MEIGKEMLDLLQCPRCRGNLILDSAKKRLICKKCKLRYQIQDGIPIMLTDEAEPIEADDS